jgi:DNA-binding response OmpR family regulator
MNILIVEDEQRVADFVARGLKAEGHTVTIARTGHEGLTMVLEGPFDVIVLDQMLPGPQGKDIAAAARQNNILTPILMLTALDGVDDRVEGLRAGADDYLPKPFAFDELIARLEALVRRSNNFASGGRRWQVGDLVFDRDAMQATRAGVLLTLTAKELAILDLLMSKPGHVLSRERILSRVWGYGEDPLTNVVDVYIARLRKKLEEHGPPMIETARGLGYRLTAAPTAKSQSQS